MSKTLIVKPVIVAIGAGLLGSSIQIANAAESPFAMTGLSNGYTIVAEAAEGKCGAEKKAEEGKCGAEKKAEEGKCGAEKKAEEGKCGAEKKAEEGKCGAEKKAEEGKCGAGK